MENEAFELIKMRKNAIHILNMKQIKSLEKLYFKQKNSGQTLLPENLKYGVMTEHADGSKEIFIPDVPYDISKVKTHNSTGAIDISDEERELRDFENESRSLRRTRKSIKHHIRNNNHTHFLTLTFNEKYPDNQSRIKRVDTWLKSMRKKYGDITYVLVFELHKSGLIHVHGCMNLDSFKLTPAVSPNTGKDLFDSKGRRIFNLDDWKSTGFSTVTEMGSSAKVSNYITKYITKDVDEVVEKGKKRYRASISQKPQQRYLSQNEIHQILSQNEVSYKNEFGSFLDII